MSQKTARLVLWVAQEGANGQHSRPCNVAYGVNPIGSHFLYRIDSITDAWLPKAYSVDSVISLNGCLDELIAAADPEQVAFAKRELGKDITKPQKKKPKPSAQPIAPGQLTLHIYDEPTVESESNQGETRVP